MPVTRLTLVGAAMPDRSAVEGSSPDSSSGAPAGSRPRVGVPSSGTRPILDAPVVTIHAADPILKSGIEAQLVASGMQVTETEDDPATNVIVALVEQLDEATATDLRGMRSARGLPIVLVVSALDADAAERVLDCGVTSVVARTDATAERLATAARYANRSDVAFPVAMLRPLLQRISCPETSLPDDGDAETTPRVAASTRLTGREREVLSRIAEGLSTREIAEELSYSERTIKNILQTMSTRLQLRNRTHLVAHAIRHGWI